jgi:hypothetical protein
MPSKSRNENHPKIAPKMTRKSQRAKRRKSSQRRILPYIQRSGSIYKHSNNLVYGAKEMRISPDGWVSIHLPRAIHMKSSSGGKWPRYPYNLNRRYTPLRGTLVKKWIFPSDVHAFAAILLPFIASSVIPPPPAEPSVLALWLNQETHRFCG